MILFCIINRFQMTVIKLSNHSFRLSSKMRQCINKRVILFLSLLSVIALMLLLFKGNSISEEAALVDEPAISLRIKKPKNVFFDLGANNGDSIENFMGVKSAGHGGNIRDKIAADKLDEHWTIYAVEGNSLFDSQLHQLKTKYSKYFDFVMLNGTIVTTYDGFITFYLDTNDRYGNQVGSSIKENHPDVIRSNKVNKTKPCVDLARLLKQYDEQDYVVVKMDVEGAEFDIIMHLLKQNALKYIDVLAVEYHFEMAPFKTPTDVLSLIYKTFGVKEAVWN